MITINLFHAVLFVHSFIITYQFTRHPLGTGSYPPPTRVITPSLRTNVKVVPLCISIF